MKRFRKEQMRNEIDIDGLLRDFASSPQAAKLREEIRSFSCPTPKEIEAFCRQEWEEERAQQLWKHLLGCPLCARQVARLRGEDGLPEELCDLLGCYLNNLIPLGPPGERLKEKIERHLESCDECREQANRATWEILEWTAIQQALEKVQWAGELVKRVAELAIRQRELAQRVEASRAARRKTWEEGVKRSGEEITALVFDQEGKLVLNETGDPLTVKFEVTRREITGKGGLFIQLFPVDEAYCQRDGPVYTVQASLQQGDRCLIFPPVEIRSGEPTTIRKRLGIEVEVRQIPSETLKLTIQPRGLN